MIRRGRTRFPVRVSTSIYRRTACGFWIETPDGDALGARRLGGRGATRPTGPGTRHRRRRTRPARRSAGRSSSAHCGIQLRVSRDHPVQRLSPRPLTAAVGPGRDAGRIGLRGLGGRRFDFVTDDSWFRYRAGPWRVCRLGLRCRAGRARRLGLEAGSRDGARPGASVPAGADREDLDPADPTSARYST